VSVVRDAGRITAAGLLLAVVAALVVVVLGVEHDVRAWYGLHPSSPSRVSATHVFANNIRTCAIALLGAVNLRLWPRARWLLDPILAALLAINVLLVGAALGAYGTPLLRLVAAHALLELMAAAAAGAAYLHARRREPLSLAALAWCAVATVGLLLLAAVLEVHGA